MIILNYDDTFELIIELIKSKLTLFFKKKFFIHDFFTITILNFNYHNFIRF